MDAAYALAKNVMDIEFSSIPTDVVNATKKQILDTIGTAMAGSKALGINMLVDLLKDWGGKQESTLFGYGGKLPAIHAAQANASMSHALDYDDTHEGGHIHCSVAVVPTAFAIAERQGNVGGREFITAVALGLDLSCRMSTAVKLAHTDHPQGGWHFTPLFGYFSAAATAGKLLGLNEEKMVNALGIAFHQTSGNVRCVVDGAMTKRMGPGFAVRGGIMAALMAEKGITGARNSLEAERGFYNLYHAGCDTELLLSDLGKRFEGANASLKPYPCCRYNHQYITLVLDIMKENNLNAEDIEQIIANVSSGIGDVCFPLEVKTNPRNIIDCQFSLPWTMAGAAVRNKVGLGEFTDESRNDESILRLAKKIVLVVDENLTNEHDPASVSIKTRKGEFHKQGGAILGSPGNPLSMDAIIHKFEECAAYGIKPLSGPSVDKLIDTISNLEQVNDVTCIPQMLG